MIIFRPPKHNYYLVSETNERLTFEAPDDKVAFMCGLWLGNAIAVCYRPEDRYLNRIIASYCEYPYNPHQYAWQYLKEDPFWFVRDHIVELDYALQSVVFERPLGGQMLTSYLDQARWVQSLRSELVGR